MLIEGVAAVHCEMSTLVVLVLLASCSVIALVAEAQEDCQRPPLWIFFREEDVETIFPTLPEEIVLVENGEVESLVSRPDPVIAELVYIFADVEEFPIIWCIRSDTYQELGYSLSFLSLETDVIDHPGASIPLQGVITSQPYRFRVILRCLKESPTNPTLQVNISITARDGASVNFCPVVFYFSKDCQGTEPDEMPTGLANAGITDGYIDFNASFKDPPTQRAPPPINNLRVILPAILVPLVIVTLIVLGVVLSVWSVWYRRKSVVLESLQLEDISAAYQQVHDPWTKRGAHEKEFPLDNLKLSRELGEGAFGIVYQAEAQGILGDDSQWVDVAVKQLRKGSDESDDFFREVDFMSKLDHPNIVKLLGVCSVDEPYSMIFEYMDLGDLSSFLREAVGLGKIDGEGEDETEEEDNIEPLLTKEELLTIVHQVAEGMVYISSLHLVHRDLATRNCLVATGLLVKIGDFGMSRNVNQSDYYRVRGSAMLPIRWMSPESTLYGKFTVETDVWTYGILLWEVFTFGQQPFYGLQNEEVIQFIQKGGHPEPPEDCPVESLMLQCWERNPKKRPGFAAIAETIQEVSKQYQSSIEQI